MREQRREAELQRLKNVIAEITAENLDLPLNASIAPPLLSPILSSEAVHTPAQA